MVERSSTDVRRNPSEVGSAKSLAARTAPTLIAGTFPHPPLCLRARSPLPERLAGGAAGSSSASWPSCCPSPSKDPAGESLSSHPWEEAGWASAGILDELDPAQKRGHCKEAPQPDMR